MKVYRDLHKITAAPSVITVGNFDGIHLGHRKIISKMTDIVHKEELRSLVFSFWPHPRQVFSPEDQSLKFITTIDERIRILETLGIENLLLFPFDLNFANYSYRYFVKNILIDRLGLRHLLIGYNHRFGKGQQGDYQKLVPLSEQYKFTIEEVGPLILEGQNISSSLVREKIRLGEIAQVNRYLGYNFFLRGKVVHGLKIGRKIGYPTANVKLNDEHKLIPGFGVYAVTVHLQDKMFKGMLSIGNRPTIKDFKHETAIEVHIFDFDEDIYNQDIHIEIVDKVRNQIRFESLEELKNKIDEDKLKVKEILK